MLQYKTVPVTSYQQNSSLVWCDVTDEGVIIDPGGDIHLLVQAVNDNNISLKAIWLTHGHLDHIGGTAELMKIFNLPVIGPHIDDDFLIKAIPQQIEMFGFPQVKSFTPDKWLTEDDILTVGNEKLSVIFTPGHTPGHIVLKHEKQKLLWVGDVLFKHAIGRTDFPRGNHQQLITSIKNKLLCLSNEYRFIPGHGPESTIGEEKLNNPFLI